MIERASITQIKPPDGLKSNGVKCQMGDQSWTRSEELETRIKLIELGAKEGTDVQDLKAGITIGTMERCRLLTLILLMPVNAMHSIKLCYGKN